MNMIKIEKILLRHGPIGPAYRFASNITVAENGCWLWTGPLDKDGYALFRIYKAPGNTPRAHRIAYQWTFGDLPPLLDHIVCDTRRCVNPFHLEPSTDEKNVLRGSGPTAENAKKTHCKYGHPLDDARAISPPAAKGRKWRECRICRRNRKKLWRTNRTLRDREAKSRSASANSKRKTKRGKSDY